MAFPDRRAEAVDHLETALRRRSDYAEAHGNLGIILARADLIQPAMQHFEAALRIKPDSEPLHMDLAVALSGIPGRVPEAIAEF